jgi:hypothetical protein
MHLDLAGQAPGERPKSVPACPPHLPIVIDNRTYIAYVPRPLKNSQRVRHALALKALFEEFQNSLLLGIEFFQI